MPWGRRIAATVEAEHTRPVPGIDSDRPSGSLGHTKVWLEPGIGADLVLSTLSYQQWASITGVDKPHDLDPAGLGLEGVSKQVNVPKSMAPAGRSGSRRTT